MADKYHRKARLTQRLVNSFPDWSDIRMDEQSSGYQFFNSIGVVLDDLLKEIQTATAGLYLGTAPINRLDMMYRAQLPSTFEFEKADNDDTEQNYLSPVVSGQVGSTFYEVILAEDNEICNFVKVLPSRISLIQSYTDTNDCRFVIASGLVADTPLSSKLVNDEIGLPSRLYITLSSGESYLWIDESTMRPHRGIIQVMGTSRYGYTVAEELSFIYDEKQPTLNEYDTLSGINIFGISNPTTTNVVVQSMDFLSPPYKSAFYLDYAKTGEDIATFWDIGDGISSPRSTLDLVTYQQAEIDLRVAGFPETYVAYSQELKDSNGDPVCIRDLAVQPFSDHIWMVSTDNRLFCYSAELPCMNLKSITKTTTEKSCRIETDVDWVLEGDSITIWSVWRTPTKGIARHRLWAEHEDGTKYIVGAWSLQDYNSALDYWVYGEPITRGIRPAITLTLPKVGVFTFVLEVTMGDETTEMDKRVIVCSPQQTPLAEFDLSAYLTDTISAGIHIDDDNYIWILGCDNYLYKINRHYDKMLIDYEKKIIYCSEEYDKIIVGE